MKTMKIGDLKLVDEKDLGFMIQKTTNKNSYFFFNKRGELALFNWLKEKIEENK